MKRSWRSWHLLMLFALGAVLEELGKQLGGWAGERLKKAWFPGDGDKDDGDDERRKP